ncbi:PASTA domain-containing protein [Aestuariimicrobium soli]|uniref:PASTA domain-containing protein n=1 Tax=Aestuariimicrobium soli TaxID=2035834 RepID=UPI003EBDC220
MLASTRPDPTRDERTVPDPDGRTAPPRPVSHRPTSPHSEPLPALATSAHRLPAPTPQSPVDHSAPGHGSDYRLDLTGRDLTSPNHLDEDDQDSDSFSVPRPARTSARPRTHLTPSRSPRSPRTPVFAHISQEPVHRRRRGLVAAVLVLVLVASLVLTSYLYVTRWSYTTAPALVSLSEGQATAEAHSAGFSLVTDTVFSESVPKGDVISSEPVAGERVKKGTQLHLFVSAGPERYPAPKLVGLTLDEAKQALTQGRLTLGTVTQTWHETVPAGQVLKASQSEGAPLKKNTPIDLTVSKGPQPITIPSLVGKPAVEAKDSLTKLGFEVTSTEKNSDTVAKGAVISQTPARGTGKKGDKIALVVSKGPVLVSVPRVTGKDEAAARALLTQAGFKVSVVYNTPDWLRLNVVAGQDPGSGKLIPKGSTVTVYIS